MACDESLAQRVRTILSSTPGLTEKKMFGGLGFLVHGNMAGGVHGRRLIVRVGQERYDEALSRPHASPFDLTGRPMRGWVWIDPQGVQTDEELRRWVSQGLEYALSLPPK
jgi:TfoX/Sxy family transcriptional regulator of competence genes